jgi:hypothetical protein
VLVVVVEEEGERARATRRRYPLDISVEVGYTRYDLSTCFIFLSSSLGLELHSLEMLFFNLNQHLTSI